MKGATIMSSHGFRFRPVDFPGVYAKDHARIFILAAVR